MTKDTKRLIDVKLPNRSISLRVDSNIYNALIQKHNMPPCACCMRNGEQSIKRYRANGPKLFEDLLKFGELETKPDNNEEKYFLELSHTNKALREYDL